MANYYGQGRTNYFAVKDEAAFREDAGNLPVELVERVENEQTLFGFLDRNQDGGGWDNYVYDPETGDETEIVWEDFFAKHLADDWVAVVLETGAEKYRYLVGYATAYNNKGEVKHISLDDIYDVAKYLGENVTTASY